MVAAVGTDEGAILFVKDECVVRLAVDEFGVVAVVADFQTDVYCRCVFRAKMKKRIGETVLLDIRLQFTFG